MGIKGSKTDVTLLLICLAVSFAVNIILAYRLNKLQPTVPEPLASGEMVPALAVVSIAGVKEVIEYSNDKRPTIVYMFTPACPYCYGNLDNIKYLAKNKANEYRFIGISLDDAKLSDYLEEVSLNFPVYTRPSNEVFSAYRMGGVPQTVVVSPEGKIIREWRGAYIDKQRETVEEFFLLSLPGFKSTISNVPVKNQTVL